MRKVILTPVARLDLLEIWHFIARDSIDAADRVTEEIRAAFNGLAVMPGKGHQRTDVRNPVMRFWSVYSYVIGYRVDDDSLTVVRVIQGNRNFRRLFGRGK